MCVIIVFVLLMVSVGILVYGVRTSDILEVTGIACTSVLGILCGVLILVTGIEYYAQIKAPFEFDQLNEQEQIYQNKADTVLEELKSYLASAYPEHEREVFENLSRNNANEVIDVYFVKYPELKANETFMSLARSTQEMRSKIYEVQLQKAELKKSVRFRPHNPWIFNWFIPKVDLSEY